MLFLLGKPVYFEDATQVVTKIEDITDDMLKNGGMVYLPERWNHPTFDTAILKHCKISKVASTVPCVGFLQYTVGARHTLKMKYIHTEI